MSNYYGKGGLSRPCSYCTESFRRKSCLNALCGNNGLISVGSYVEYNNMQNLSNLITCFCFYFI